MRQPHNQNKLRDLRHAEESNKDNRQDIQSIEDQLCYTYPNITKY